MTKHVVENRVLYYTLYDTTFYFSEKKGILGNLSNPQHEMLLITIIHLLLTAK